MLAKQRILVVDDTSDSIDVLDGILSKDYKIRAALNGEKALKIARSASPPDLILLDIMMPGMNGYEVCRHLKADERTRDIPVIFLSVLEELSDKIKAFQIGGVDYIAKPFQTEEVLARVETHMMLRQRTATLEVANNALQEFAYVVSHDLKAPLRGINQLVNWLIKDYADAFDDKGIEMVELLTSRVERMDRLIDEILQYSRAGRVKGDTKEIDLNILVREVLDMLAPPESIRVTFEDKLPVVMADRTCLEQVFLNLLNNAVKFMDKSEGNITIECINEGSHWTFSVADNGPGIPEKGGVFSSFQK